MVQIECQNLLSTKSWGGMKIGIATLGDMLTSLFWAVRGLNYAQNAIMNHTKSF